jgi:hypothetical protein
MNIFQGSPFSSAVTGSILVPSFLYSSIPKSHSHLLPHSPGGSSITTPPMQRLLMPPGISTGTLRLSTKLKMSDVKIAIIGGGICGVTAAHAIESRLKSMSPKQNVEIIIFEADSNSFQEGAISSQADFKNKQQPEWRAATSRNANSLGNCE